MAYKRRRSYRKSRPRKRRRTAYRRKRYTRRYSKFYNMRQRNPKSRSTFNGTRDVVFDDAPSRTAIAPQSYASWNPYLTAALSAGALGLGYQGYRAHKWLSRNGVYDAFRNDWNHIDPNAKGYRFNTHRPIRGTPIKQEPVDIPFTSSENPGFNRQSWSNVATRSRSRARPTYTQDKILQDLRDITSEITDPTERAEAVDTYYRALNTQLDLPKRQPKTEL